VTAELLSNGARRIDPLRDPRWCALVGAFPAASIFHSPAWLQALHLTYGYTPVALTTSDAEGEPRGVLLFCQVNSWLSGRRLVSLPFSDHCEPLACGLNDLLALLDGLKAAARGSRCQYVEIRALDVPLPGDCGLEPSQRFCHHLLDLRPSAADLFNAFHKDCVQRKIQRAQREGLVYEEGRSPDLLRMFYHLQILTRRRQQLPPQPFEWFRNLAACMGDKLRIRVVSKDGKPLASILTLQDGCTLVYKYGCSDRTFSNLGGTQLLFWRAIQEAKSEGLSEFDLGVSDWENEGLIRFKDRLGAARSAVAYWTYPGSAGVQARSPWKLKAAKRIFSWLPSAWLPTVGKLLYKHVG
jgi:Acetyltransferase (GNAT) domain